MRVLVIYILISTNNVCISNMYNDLYQLVLTIWKPILSYQLCRNVKQGPKCLLEEMIWTTEILMITKLKQLHNMIHETRFLSLFNLGFNDNKVKANKQYDMDHRYLNDNNVKAIKQYDPSN